MARRQAGIMEKIKIVFQNLTLSAELNSTKTAEAIKNALPIQSTVNTWGDEIYFSTNIEPVETPTSPDVEVGDIAYWPPGKAICVFFGPTPASIDHTPLAASAVVVLGKVTYGLEKLGSVKDRENVRVEVHN